MTIAYASNQASGLLTTSGSGVATLTLASTTTAGNAIVVVLAQGITIGVPAYTVSDNYGNVYTLLYSANINSNPVLVFVATNIVAGASHQLTFTYPFPFVVPLTAWTGEFSGLLANSVVAEAVNSNQDSGATTSHLGGGVTTIHSGDLMLGIYNGGSFMADSGTWTQGSGYTLGVSLRNMGGGFGSFCLEWKVAGSPGAENAAATTANSVAVPSMATVGITNLNIGLVPLRFAPTALASSGKSKAGSIAFSLSASALVSGVTHTATMAGNVFPVFHVSAAGIKVGNRPAGSGPNPTARFGVTAAGFFIGNKAESAGDTLVFGARASAVYVRYVSSLATVGGQGVFVGYVELEGILAQPLLVLDGGLSPLDADAAPTFRVFGPDGRVPGVVGRMALLDAGTITGATATAPVVYTSANHGLTTGVCVTAYQVEGLAGANTSGPVVVLDANTFTINSSVGTGNYTGGGSWCVTGLFLLEFDVTSAAGFEVGTTYTIQDATVVNESTVPGDMTFVVT